MGARCVMNNSALENFVVLMLIPLTRSSPVQYAKSPSQINRTLSDILGKERPYSVLTVKKFSAIKRDTRST